MARTLAYLLGAGAVLAILSIVVQSSVNAPDVGIAAPIAAVAVTALALAVALRIRGAAVLLRGWRFQLLLAGATTLVTAAVWMDGPSSRYATFYVLIALYAAYFFTRLQTSVQVVFAASSYAAAVLAQDPSPGDVARWVITVGVLGVASMLVFATKGRLEGVISRLEAAARTDVLTGLLNRRGFEETIETELERAKRSGRELSLIVGDLDHFKALNDLCGHGAGDDALEARRGRDERREAPHRQRGADRRRGVRRARARKRRARGLHAGRAPAPGRPGRLRRRRAGADDQLRRGRLPAPRPHSPRASSWPPTRRSTPPRSWAATAR